MEADAPAAGVPRMRDRAAAASPTDLFEHGLCLPSGSSLTDDDQRRVIDVIWRATARRVP